MRRQTVGTCSETMDKQAAMMESVLMSTVMPSLSYSSKRVTCVAATSHHDELWAACQQLLADIVRWLLFHKISCLLYDMPGKSGLCCSPIDAATCSLVPTADHSVRKVLNCAQHHTCLGPNRVV